VNKAIKYDARVWIFLAPLFSSSFLTEEEELSSAVRKMQVG